MNGVIDVFSKEKKKELIKALRKIFDDKEFVLGVLCDLASDEDIDIVLSYIKQHENVSAEDIILLSLNIAEQDDEIIVDDFNILRNNVEVKS